MPTAASAPASTASPREPGAPRRSVDNDCFEPIDGRIAVALTVEDSRLVVDFAGTSPQIKGFKNSSIANSTSAVYMALASFFEPDLPRNEGTFRSVEIRLPEGTLVNARMPAPMTMNTVFVAHEIVHVMWKALGQALPERASAGWSKAVHAVTAGLREDGGRYVMYQWAGAPAGGGVEGRDGFHLIGHLITLGGLTLPNLETYEQLYPVRFRRQELRCDSAGPGRFRGGAGCDYEVEMFTPADYAFRGEGAGAPSSFGAAGGRAGGSGEVILTLADGKKIEAPEVRRAAPSPSVPADPSEGVLGVLRLAAQQLDLPLSALLRDCALFVHGSTVATNTILEKKGAKVGLLTTAGFRDSLEIRRGIRENQWDHRAPFPEVLAPRYLRLPVRGRIDADGRELAPLVAEDVDAAAKVFAEEGVESVAVCLFNSFLDGAHERAAGARLAKSWAGQWISLSSEVMPTMGEYERSSTAVVNAYIAPKVTSYLGALDQQLRQLGLPRSLLLLQSNGGAVSVDQVASRPVMLVLSGPAAGVGALKGCAAPGEAANLISMEIGGTSCDVMVMAKGQVPVADELVIDGYHLTTPSVEIHTVGAGGGAIAWVDDAGLLHVGPQGAGARPGPAAYGLGGENPTVTDAQLVLGRLRPGPLAGGVTLDGKLARQAIETKLAKPLGLSVEDAASGVIRLLEQNLLHAVERLSIERGHNPATFTLVAAGGAGPMHGAEVARALGCKRALLPRAAGAFCAMGMLQSDVRQDYMHVFLADLDTVDRAEPRSGLRRARSARPRSARPRGIRQRLGRSLARGRSALRRPAMAGARRAGRGLRCRRGAATIRGRASAAVRSHPARREARHHRAARGRPRPAGLDAAARRLRRRLRRPSRAKSARSGSIPPMAGTTCRSTRVPISGRAANSTGRC